MDIAPPENGSALKVKNLLPLLHLTTVLFLKERICFQERNRESQKLSSC